MSPEELPQFMEQLSNLEAKTLDHINNAIMETAMVQEKKVEEAKNSLCNYAAANTIGELEQKFNK
jgi:hypothetical protein